MLDKISCEMQLDTGATVSIVPKNLNDKQLNQWLLQCTNYVKGLQWSVSPCVWEAGLVADSV